MFTFEKLLNISAEIEKKLGYSFKDKYLLALAFVHRSYVNENKAITQHNERLEFLGDSILGLIIANYLYFQLPHTSEGELSYLRSRLVEANSCMNYMMKLNVHSFLLLGKGERMNDGRGRESILSDLFEALIGAIYIDGGLAASEQFLLRNFQEEIEAIIKTPLCNWKATLQDYCQKKYQSPPEYKLINEIGPDHSKVFTVTVEINSQILGRGEGASKKEAQQAAAKDALQKLTPLGI